MTADSTAEQASAGLDRLSETNTRIPPAQRRLQGEIRHAVHRLRAPARQGIRSCASSSGACSNDAAAERETALAEIFRIVALRLDQRVDAPDRLEVHGRLSTHVLDNAWRPARGRASRSSSMRLRPNGATASDQARSDQRRRPHRRAADRRTADPDRAIRIALSPSATTIAAPGAGAPIRRSSASCRSGSRSPSRKGTTTCRCWSRPGAIRPIAEADNLMSI